MCGISTSIQAAAYPVCVLHLLHALHGWLTHRVEVVEGLAAQALVRRADGAAAEAWAAAWALAPWSAALNIGAAGRMHQQSRWTSTYHRDTLKS